MNPYLNLSALSNSHLAQRALYAIIVWLLRLFGYEVLLFTGGF